MQDDKPIKNSLGQIVEITKQSQNWVERYVPQLTCLVVQVSLSIILIIYLYKHRKQSPIIQNSPKVTISAQIALVMCSLCLFLAKIFVNFNGKSKDQKCLVDEYDARIIALSMLYSFCLEYNFSCYFLKMFRVILICKRGSNIIRFYVNKFKRQKNLVLIALIWTFLIMLLDLITKLEYQNNQLRVRLTPQMVQFLCDEFVPETKTKYQVFIVLVWSLRQAVIFLLFMWSFWQSFKLQELDDILKLKKQYIVILFLPLISIMLDKILDINHGSIQINSAIYVHYTNCGSNIMATIWLIYIFCFNSECSHLYLPSSSDLQQNKIQRYYIFSRPDCQQVIKQYFKSIGKLKMFETIQKHMKKDYDHLSYSQEKLNQILNAIDNEGQEQKILKCCNNLSNQIQKAKIILQKQAQIHIQQWQKTISATTMIYKWAKYDYLYRNMKILNLVPEETPSSQITDLKFSSEYSNSSLDDKLFQKNQRNHEEN